MLSNAGFSVDERWLRRLFFALALLYVLPFWAVRYIPTMDGPCHTYNAWILRQHGNVEEYPLFQRYYEISWRPYPNWVSHGSMALLMFVVPPRMAEKLLVSGYALLFLGGAWYLAGAVRPGERWPAFLAFPFTYHQLFQNGFYNFSISVGLFLFALGFWWRHRAGPQLAFAVKINLLLWLCYFAHILSLTLALAAIGILWLATLRRERGRRHLLHLPILLPQLVLPLWFWLGYGDGAVGSEMSLELLWRYFTRLKVLATFSGVQQRWATALAILFLLLLLGTLLRKILRRPFLDEADAFLLAALFCIVLFVFSPAGLAGGAFLKERLSLYPYLLLIPWLSPGLGRKAREIVTAALIVVALLNLGYLIRWYRMLDGEVGNYLSGLAGLEPHQRVLPILYNRTRRTDALNHAIDYKALEMDWIDWDNYQGWGSFFPIRFRGSMPLPSLPETETNPDALRIKVNRRFIDAVYTWQMPPYAPLRNRLSNHYRRVAARSGGELWVRRRLARE